MGDKKSFESLLKRLEEIVLKLEKGDVTLDESLGLFEEGVKTADVCNVILDKAEQKITILSKNQGEEISETAFEKGEDSL